MVSRISQPLEIVARFVGRELHPPGFISAPCSYSTITIMMRYRITHRATTLLCEHTVPAFVSLEGINSADNLIDATPSLHGIR